MGSGLRCPTNRSLRLVQAGMILASCTAVILTAVIRAPAQDSIAIPPRVLPPAGERLSTEAAAQLSDALTLLEARLAAVRQHPLEADVAIYSKALRYALEFREFYSDKDVAKARRLIERANERLAALAAGQTPWASERGLVVRGFRSRIDGSPQPYGLVIPDGLDLGRPAPLYVWLHGRGDKQTDLHFLAERHASRGQIAPPDAIVVHPFGRQCLGFKSAGEIDVLEAVEHVQRHYRVDPDRIVLIGFSMGGAGAWHLGAHYTDRWCAVSPGAGFAETAQYNRLAPENYPPAYEQRLWGLYDVPNYVRNLFNVPVIAYSGENDKQIQAARVMEQAFRQEGRTLDHRIGPGVEHKYEPQTLEKLLADLRAVVERGRDRAPRTVLLQIQTLRYPRQGWVQAEGLAEHWRDARIDASVAENAARLEVVTKNVTALRLTPPVAVPEIRVSPPAQMIAGPFAAGDSVTLVRSAEGWARLPSSASNSPAPRVKGKRPGLQGPIDDAFLEPFVVVTPTGKAKSREVERWVAAELAHWTDRWRSVFRGELPTKRDDELTDQDIAEKHLVLFGDAESNSVIQRVHGRLPIHWPNGQVQVGDRRFPADRHLPALIYPNPLNESKYVVLNSGPTFRAAHDRTNSLQNPKLPDWAILEITQPPSGERAGRVVLADFFDERWELRRESP